MLLSLLLAGCSSATGARDDRSEEQSARPEQVVSPEHLAAFGALLGSGALSDFTAPTSIEGLVRIAPIVVSGELVRVEPGRKEFLFHGCDADIEDEGKRDPCAGKPPVAVYASHVNLRLRTKHVWKGSLPEVDADVHLERPWPNNVPTEELMRTTPRGVRVIAFARLVENAGDLAKPLEDERPAGPNDIPENLMDLAPFGLVFESIDQTPTLPLMQNQELREIMPRDPADLTTFDGVIDAIDAALL